MKIKVGLIIVFMIFALSGCTDDCSVTISQNDAEEQEVIT